MMNLLEWWGLGVYEELIALKLVSNCEQENELISKNNYAEERLRSTKTSNRSPSSS